jgi:hypothetical protein
LVSWKSNPLSINRERPLASPRQEMAVKRQLRAGVGINLPNEVEAVHASHVEIDEDHVGPEVVVKLDTPPGRIGAAGLVPPHRDQGRHRFQGIAARFQNQHSQRGLHRQHPSARGTRSLLDDYGHLAVTCL